MGKACFIDISGLGYPTGRAWAHYLPSSRCGTKAEASCFSNFDVDHVEGKFGIEIDRLLVCPIPFIYPIYRGNISQSKTNE